MFLSELVAKIEEFRQGWRNVDLSRRTTHCRHAFKGIVEEVKSLKKPRKRKIKAPSGNTYTVEDE